MTDRLVSALRVVNNATLVDPATGVAYTNQGVVLDPETTLQFYEDFQSRVEVTAGQWVYDHAWRHVGTTTAVSDLGGVVQVAGDGVTQGSLFPGQTGVFHTIYQTAQRFDCRMRVAQRGVTGSTRRFGLGAAVLNVDGTGIYFRHTTGGEITALGRASGLETTLATGITAANGTFHTFRLVAVEDQTIEVWVDGAQVGVISSGNVPTSVLGLSLDSGATTVDGLTVDYVSLVQNR